MTNDVIDALETGFYINAFGQRVSAGEYPATMNFADVPPALGS
jgi:hypothetical protein